MSCWLAVIGAAVIMSLVCWAPAAPLQPAAGDDVVVDGALADYLTVYARHVLVERVIDGDTIAVTGDERVRLLTVNAPELHRSTKADDAECGAEASRDALALQLPVGTQVVVNGLKGEPKTDRYGRTLANVYEPIPSTRQLVNVSLWLVEQGWAQVFVDYPTSDSDTARALQNQAQAAHRGMWASCPAAA